MRGTLDVANAARGRLRRVSNRPRVRALSELRHGTRRGGRWRDVSHVRTWNRPRICNAGHVRRVLRFRIPRAPTFRTVERAAPPLSGMRRNRTRARCQFRGTVSGMRRNRRTGNYDRRGRFRVRGRSDGLRFLRRFRTRSGIGGTKCDTLTRNRSRRSRVRFAGGTVCKFSERWGTRSATVANIAARNVPRATSARHGTRSGARRTFPKS